VIDGGPVATRARGSRRCRVRRPECGCGLQLLGCGAWPAVLVAAGADLRLSPGLATRRAWSPD